MSFGSPIFFIFSLALLIGYWCLVKSGVKLHVVLLLFGNIFFYGLYGGYGVLIFAIQFLLSYYAAKLIASSNERIKKTILILSVLGLLSILAFHKYLIMSLPEKLVFDLPALSLNLVFPLGLSFYTFQSFVYIVDVYWEKFPPSENMLYYATYLSFFPTILSGPIPRFDNFENMFLAPRLSNQVVIESLRLILYGLFKKLVVAAVCGIYVEEVFNDATSKSSTDLIVGASVYSILIYSDFSGYSDIALGFAGLFGIRIPKNFNLPYLATNIPEFWRRWHMSLSSILNEYLFTPLNFSLRTSGKLGIVIATLITFLLCGVWHGDTLNFVLWGFFNGIMFLPSIFIKPQVKNLIPDDILRMGKMVLTFLVVSLLWVMFKNSDISSTFNIYSRLLDFNAYSIPDFAHLKYILFVVGFILFDLLIEKKKYMISFKVFKWKLKLQYIIYYALLLSILFANIGGRDEFIYFKF
jgi:D-alanyl-lipoteichoic acid acyltransferase DltB (MBOAT superfamily)